ncbi:MAG: Terminase-like family protein [Methanosaeta sp. PtaU1.Bin112]|nr:MAG: Terminase-like family protein [Methanosaeta sp. PtaU1.Bin112]
MSLSFVIWAMANFNSENFILAGKTIGSLRRNVVAPLKRMLIGRGMVCIDHRADNMLEISYLGHTNYFYVFGGKDESSQDLVQGITAAGAYFDEVALQPESFVNQAVGRCSVDGAKLWFNCNPESPYHWFKEKWIDRAKELGLYVMHFLMDDNPSLSGATKARYRQLYAAGTVFFKRYILGLWCIAEGAVYDFFSSDPKDGYVITTLPQSFEKWRVAVDYGASNPCVFGLYGLAKGVWYKVKEKYYEPAKSGSRTDKQLSDDMRAFLVWNGHPVRPKSMDVDPSAKHLIEQLRKDFPGVVIYPARNAVLDGIQAEAQALTSGLFKIYYKCKKTIEEHLNYVWDAKAQERGEDKPVKKNDHTCDETRYWAMRVFSGLAKAGAKPRGL